MKEKLNKIAEEMYNLNRYISLNNIGLKKIVNQNEIETINRCIGEWIKKIRNIVEVDIQHE